MPPGQTYASYLEWNAARHAAVEAAHAMMEWMMTGVVSHDDRQALRQALLSPAPFLSVIRTGRI